MLKVLTLNIWNRTGPWERRRELIRAQIDRIAPDVIGLQEVLRGDTVDQLADLAPAGFHTDFACAQPFWEDGRLEFGNAVCSRWPIVAREETRLPDNGDDEHRVALSVTIDAPFGALSVTSTHLNWKLHHGFVRERQVAALADAVVRRRPRGGFPPVVVGDFNAEPDSSEIRFMTGLHPIDGRSVLFYDAWRVAGDGGPGATWSNRNPFARIALEPDRRIDYVFAGYPVRTGADHGLGHIESCRVVCDEEVDGVCPSDHYGVLAELRTEPVR